MLGSLSCLNFLWLGLSSQLSLALRWELAWSFVALLLPLALALRERRDATFDRPLRALFAFMLTVVFAAWQMQQLKLFNQVAMSLPLPWADQRLIAWDVALGFDWNAYALAIASYSSLQATLHFAYYHAITVGLGLLLFRAIWWHDLQRVDEIAFLALVSGVTCITISVLFPAVSAWQTVAMPETVQRLGGRTDMNWVTDLQMLRGGGPVIIDPRTMEGLSTFPSYHTCLGIILIWCSRGQWMSALLGGFSGLAVIAATPIFGGHYLVDLFGGAAVMTGVILLWTRVSRASAFRRSVA